MSLLFIRPQSTCFTTSGSRQSLFPLAITIWRWPADPWSRVNPTCCTSSANGALNNLSKSSASRSMFPRGKGTVNWTVSAFAVNLAAVFTVDKCVWFVCLFLIRTYFFLKPTNEKQEGFCHEKRPAKKNTNTIVGANSSTPPVLIW